MPTNLNIDDALLLRAQRVSGLATKRATVEQALRDLIRKRLRRKVADSRAAASLRPEFEAELDRKLDGWIALTEPVPSAPRPAARSVAPPVARRRARPTRRR